MNRVPPWRRCARHKGRNHVNDQAILTSVSPAPAAAAGDPRFPNFFILGAAKAGTTTLYEYLCTHPRIFLSPVKEPQFFSHDEVYERGIAYYLRTFFAGAEKSAVRGEATPHYLYFEKAAQRIAASAGGLPVRFIVMLRDPVERAYSLYWNMVAEGIETLPFEAALEQEGERSRDPELQRSGSVSIQYVDSGMYAKQLRRYLRYFGREQFLVVFLQDLHANPRQVLDQICDFLAIPRFDSLPKRHNANGASTPRSPTLHRLLRKPHWIKRHVGRCLPEAFKYKIALGLAAANRKRLAYPPLSGEIAARLRVRFAPDVRALEQLCGRRLSEWLPSSDSDSERISSVDSQEMTHAP